MLVYRFSVGHLAFAVSYGLPLRCPHLKTKPPIPEQGDSTNCLQEVGDLKESAYCLQALRASHLVSPSYPMHSTIDLQECSLSWNPVVWPQSN
jgi:hypothetical protein